MNDPWDVKSVRKSSQYQSCLKLNGVPLLPPLLSKECRKEMQYYKLLAREVEKRILLLKPCYSDSESSEDKTDAPELPESEQNDVVSEADLISNCNEQTVITDFEKSLNRSETPKFSSMSSNNSDQITSNFTPITDTPLNESSKLVIELSSSFNKTESTLHDDKQIVRETSSTELPVHDEDIPQKFSEKNQQNVSNVKLKHDSNYKNKERKPIFKISNKNAVLDQFLNFSNHDEPSSLSLKSFTGSLHDLHKDSENTARSNPLIRQRSYTVLTPSPMLLAHLKTQSINTGVEMTSISMSDSLSHISSLHKKRRSWDLETAKVKWSNMAMELKKKNIAINSVAGNRENKTRSIKKRIGSRHDVSKSVPRSRSVISDKQCPAVAVIKSSTKSEPIQKTNANSSPTVNPIIQTIPEHRSIPKDHQKSEAATPKPQLISDSEDPAKRVRELYERIQKQQLLQMATLVEKQKKEQLMLQQVFEEQNNLLYTQLKTICPKAPGEVKEAWIDKTESPGRGPVSLSQLISHKPPDSSAQNSPVASTLTDTNNYINHCDNVLRKSRDITGSIKKHHIKSNENGSIPSARSNGDGVTLARSPSSRATSRKLTYETSASTDRDFEPPLTDRTNDTMNDLNVTFPSDHSDDFRPTKQTSAMSHLCGAEVSSAPTRDVTCRSIESAKSAQDTLKSSILDIRARLVKKDFIRTPTAQERVAASKIVAYAKGYLVRRLMRTERVQSTVQTIRDALLCALQMHQDREGIRGPDVDLHRRLIQQITAACYSLHDTFITSSAAERCSLIASDRSRRRSLALRPSPRQYRPTDIMSHSHTGSFPARARRSSPTSAMTQSNHESFSGEKPGLRRYMGSPRRRPWR